MSAATPFATPVASSMISHWIGGRIVPASGSRSPVYNPTTGQAIREVALASPEVVDQAVASAKSAFPAWARLPALRRARVLFRFKELLDQNAKAIARVLSEEHGKTLSDAEGEV